MSIQEIIDKIMFIGNSPVVDDLCDKLKQELFKDTEILPSKKALGRCLVQNMEDKNTIAELKDFCIWLTGCGYDFTQHEYFNKQRDKLLKQ